MLLPPPPLGKNLKFLKLETIWTAANTLREGIKRTYLHQKGEVKCFFHSFTYVKRHICNVNAIRCKKEQIKGFPLIVGIWEEFLIQLERRIWFKFFFPNLADMSRQIIPYLAGPFNPLINPVSYRKKLVIMILAFKLIIR